MAINTPHPLKSAFLALLALAILWPVMAGAGAPLRINKATWSPVARVLTVKGNCPKTLMAGMPVELFDTSGRLLATGTSDSQHRFSFRVADERPELLCAVRVKAGGLGATKAVTWTGNKDCPKMPQCQILSPAHGAALTAHQDIPFQASARLKDRKGGPLQVEWDFGGGAKRLYTPEGKTAFERDNSRYQVRFTAWDGKKRYCEDQIAVTVGTPPTGLPAKVGEQPAPARGAGLNGDTVVLPFNDMAMQSGYPTYDTIYPWESINNLNAHVIRKGSTGDAKPKILTGADIALRYSAASNPHDPVGPGSINSTSQNWSSGGAGHPGHDHPAGGVQKLDGFWGGHGEHAGAVDMAIWWLVFPDSTYDGELWVTNTPPDEGFRSRNNVNVPGEYAYEARADSGKGAAMPGIAAPYVANDPQQAKAFLSELGLFTVEALPLSDVDDQGRVNSFPLMRVEATDKTTGTVLASADATVTHGSDMSCRECHLKGGLGADPNVARQPSDFNFHMPTAQLPTIYEPAGDDIISLEKSALLNVNSLHTWYNQKPWFDKWEYDSNDPNEGIDNWIGGGHSAFACFAHHNSTVAAEFNIQQPMIESPLDYSPAGGYPPLSKAQHGWHGRLQQDAQGKLLRDVNGNPVLWGDAGTENPQNPVTLAVGRNPNTLFPTDGDRPMEDSCLKCHAGQREQLYRDHHYTVGLKCADCHGDLLAVSQLLAKPDGSHRQDWLDQPNCGSCHSGDGAEAVAKKAYDPNDPSATTLPPKSSRFAVRPATVQIRTGNWDDIKMPLKDYTSTAFRHSRDSHANLACAACHGPGHALWPNRDPKANDNVTAQQLQGFPGSIMECKVCHTQDAFARFASLEAGTLMQQAEGLPANSGILGGPHNMHPIRDEHWWKQVADESLPGGLHDNFYRSPGRSGEDQCASCHGADHKGTRLSKTPVDLSFKLANGKVAQWKAGEEVGCNKCHTIAKSFRNGPTARPLAVSVSEQSE